MEPCLAELVVHQLKVGVHGLAALLSAKALVTNARWDRRGAGKGEGLTLALSTSAAGTLGE